MKEFFLNYLLIFSILLFTISFVGLVFFFIPLFVEKYFEVKNIINLHKASKQIEEEDFNEVIDDSFTTQELAEVERFRARLDALRKDKDGLYDVHDVRFDNFTGVETSE